MRCSPPRCSPPSSCASPPTRRSARPWARDAPRRVTDAAPRRVPDAAPRASNDTLRPKPRTEIDAKRWLDVDLPGLEIGVAEYAEGPTGCTVFSFGKYVSLHVDVRGGSPGVIGEGYPIVDAICFAAGPVYGLEAATGVAAELFARKGYSTQWNDIQLVSGGIIFDYGRRANAVYPDKELGRAAVRAFRPGRFPMGPHGAGCLATAGHGETAEIAGQGAAFRVAGPTRVAVFTVVNAYGAIVDRSGDVVRGNRDAATGKHRRAEDFVAPAGADDPPAPRGRVVTQNTDLTPLLNDQELGARQPRS